MKTIAERIRDNYKYCEETGCWLWTASKDSWGYGHIRIDTVLTKAHRFMYSEHNGKIPEGLKVCHRCDTPACINPEHLFLGTDADNMKDRDQKGRNAKGEMHGTSKLTEKDVIDIKNLLKTTDLKQREIAAIFNIGGDVISRIKTGNAWKHVT